MSDKEPEATTEPAQEQPATDRQALLEEIGRKLSEARQARGESIDEPVRKLKLHKHHLLALENGDWSGMPDEVYAFGFLRQYAGYLNLDLDEEITRLKNNQFALTRPLTFPDPPVAPSRRWAWIAGVAFIVLFIAFNIFTDSEVPESTNVSEQTQEEATESPAAEEKPAIKAVATPATADDAQAPEAVPAPAPAPAAEKTKSAPAAKEDAGKAQPALLTRLDKTAGSAAAKIGRTHHFRFEAAGDPVWLQISMPDENGNKGKLLREVLLNPGYHVSIREKTESLWITCGNAPSLRIRVDGRVAAEKGSLGTGRKVLRDYHFKIGE